MNRYAGVLMSVTSLPSPYGIGCFSQEAYDFVDWLKDAGQTYWQILPLGVTSYGDSPYQSFSAFAGNPYFISLDALVEEGVLTAAECKKANFGRKADDIDYSRLERTGCPEVIYGAGKTPDQIEEIARSLLAAGQNVLATRLSGEALDYLNRAFPAADMHPEARLMRIVPNPVPRTAGFVGIVSAGTSDQYVAEEAALTAEFLGSRVSCSYEWLSCI